MNQYTIDVKFGEQETKIPVIEINGKEDGPHIFVSGGIHGNEINGIYAVKSFLEWAKKSNLEETLKGKISVLPVLNTSGFEHSTRHVWHDQKDLNRSFGLEKIESISGEIAKTLVDRIFSHTVFGIDFHDAGGGSVHVPHSRVHKCEGFSCSTSTKEIGQLFGTEFILERDGHPNMLAVHLRTKFEISILTVEIGGARRIFEEYRNLAINGIRNVLVNRGMIQGAIVMPAKQYMIFDRYGIRSSKAGALQMDFDLGDIVHYNQKIGELYDPITQTFEPVLSPSCGILFSKYFYSQVIEGTTIFSVLETLQCHKQREEKPFVELKPLQVDKLIV